MIAAFALILVCQLFGEVVSELFDLPVPGPVIGLVLLFVGLLIKRNPPKVLTDAADNLLIHFSLLFVPAGVGVVTQIDRLKGDWLPIAAALIISTLLAMVLTALLMSKLLPKAKPGESLEDGQ
ncbi:MULTISPECIES: CidA/LrgA family protein [Thalassospira]|jgi:holin-like protein|uniref:LrgA n=3 Tax=Thalassospira TaxID=168934 RepID=A0A853L3U9_9PROT|nr:MULTISPECIES: CidA/LrgA family protein [Thalassospira]KXJ59042.1 MAG: murein hydrolase regulator LrgA [Thalassospira sp. Nap_22]MBE71683.1 CidA/LrgA family protein [Thalassospira sp.]OAZ15357.1 LrgA [Thalassospira profundimaris]AXO16609.1 CidA/LrgA family protein [Thalassospira indica]KZD01999.1 murein hydrolase regulator LrgA [Thalassospira sp. MCCC 1A02898]